MHRLKLWNGFLCPRMGAPPRVSEVALLQQILCCPKAWNYKFSIGDLDPTERGRGAMDIDHDLLCFLSRPLNSAPRMKIAAIRFRKTMVAITPASPA